MLAFTVSRTQVVFLIFAETRCPALIQDGAAVGTEQQTCKRRNLTSAIRISPDIGANLLHKIKGRLIDDRFVCIFKDGPFVFGNIMAFLVLEMFPCFEIDGMTEVLALFQNLNNGRRTPTVFINELLVFVDALIM